MNDVAPAHDRAIRPDAASSPSLSFLGGGGAAGALIAARDWSTTSLGPIGAWPQSLRTMLGFLVRSPVPMVMLWGEDGVMLYNDAYSVFAGGRHPDLLGAKVREGWPEVADFNDHVMKVGLSGGALSYKDQELTLYRHGRPEQVWMSLDYSPVLDESGRPAGVLCVLAETTERVAVERERQAAERALREGETRFRALVNASSDVVYRMSPDWTELRRLDGRGFLPDTEEPSVKWLDVYVFPDDRAQVLAAIGEAVRTRSVLELEHRVRRVDGTVGWIVSRAIPVSGAGGEIIEWFGMASDVTERHHAETLRTAQSRVLELVARDKPLADALDAIVRTVEELSSSGVLASILLLDGDGVHLRHGAGPHLPDAYNEAIDGIAVGPSVGSCGTAVHRKEPVYVSDIATDPLWADFRDLALLHELRACWSTPILSGSGGVLGTFAMYYREPREPNPADLAVVDFVVRSAALVIERKAAEGRLHEIFERYRLASLATNDAIWDWRLDTSEVVWNEAVATLFGHADAVNGTAAEWWIEHIHPDDRERVDTSIHAVIDGAGVSWTDEYRFRRADGTYATVLDRGTVLRDEAGRPLRIIGAMLDLTERKRAEEALAASETKFHAIANSVDQLIWSTTSDGNHDYYNDRWYQYTGMPEGSTDGEAWNGMFHPDDQERAWAVWRESLATGDPYHIEYRLRHRSGQYRWVIGRAQCVRDNKGRITRWYGTCTDIHDLKEAEETVRESRDRLAEETRALEILNATGAQVAAEFDLERLVQAVVDAGVELTGARFGAFFYNVANEAGESYRLYSISGVERSAFERFPMPRNTAVFAPTFAGEGVVRSEDILADPRYGKNDPHYGMPKGHLPVRSYLAVPVTSRTGEVIGGLFFGHEEPGVFGQRSERVLTGLAAQAAIAIDNARLFDAVQKANVELEERVQARTAELEKAHEALRQSQKMEAVGQLTGGIAHDFNNMLAVVIGSLDLLGRRIGVADARAKRYVDAATDGARRAANLTQRLLAFSRQQPLRPEPVEANKLVAGMSDLLRHSLGADIQLETVLAGGLWRTHADPNQLENVILNLAVNARDAMPEGGRLTIETQNTHLDGRYTAAHLGVAPGQYVLIAVTDTGSGMPEEVIAKAFDPFFTTKEIGKGTGLGLSQVYGFVKQSGGHVKIYSEPSHGTTVKVYLPRYLGGEGEIPQDEASVHLPLGESQEVVLVVEDEPAVRQFSVDALTELGYRVLEADGAAAALRLLEAHPEISLMFTDVVMPEVNGAKLAQEARRRRPDLKILFTTGYTRNAVVHNGVLDPGVELIGKPFTIEELAGRVREVLDAPT